MLQSTLAIINVFHKIQDNNQNLAIDNCNKKLDFSAKKRLFMENRTKLHDALFLDKKVQTA